MEMESKPMKKTLGRRKISMKKIEKKSSLQVTFTKRRQGLFHKARELSILCGVEVGITVQSPADKVYTFEQPSLETLINRISPGHHQIINPKSCHHGSEEGRAAAMENGRFWWDDPIEDLEIDQLKDFLAELEILSDNVAKKLTKE